MAIRLNCTPERIIASKPGHDASPELDDEFITLDSAWTDTERLWDVGYAIVVIEEYTNPSTKYMWKGPTKYFHKSLTEVPAIGLQRMEGPSADVMLDDGWIKTQLAGQAAAQFTALRYSYRFGATASGSWPVPLTLVRRRGRPGTTRFPYGRFDGCLLLDF